MSDPGASDSALPLPIGSSTVPSPVEQYDSTDPGDQTQERFNYQYGYGLILLCGTLAGFFSYTALWCEHHEDFLGARSDGKFDAFQIKTQVQELGAWKNNTKAFKNSIKRFVLLNQKFLGSLGDFYFVSNTSCYDTESLDALSTSPVQLLACVQSSQTLEQLHPDENMNKELTKGFNKMVEACGCTAEALYEVIPLDGVFFPLTDLFHLSTG